MNVTVFLVSPVQLDSWWKEAGNDSEFSFEEHPGFLRMRVQSNEAEPCLQAVGRCREKFGLKRVRDGNVDAPRLVFSLLASRDLKLACAESCTGGLIGKLLTDLPGSSQVFWGGVIVYSNEAKRTLAFVSDEILSTHGAVSRETVAALAKNIVATSAVDIGVAVSGIAGPDGGTPEKPVGTVWLGVQLKNKLFLAKKCLFSGSRDDIRSQAAVAALLLVESAVLGEENIDSF